MKKLCFVVLLLFVGTSAFSQLRYVKDMNRLNGGSVTSFNGIGGYIQYDRYLKKGLAVGTQLNFESSTIGYTIYSEVRYSVEVKYNFVSYKGIFINGFFGLSGEIMELSSDVENKVVNKGLYGNNFGVEFEYYVYDMISLNLKVGQRIYYVGGNTHYNSLNLGIAYSFY